jgi:hypothetical protein
MVSKDRSFPQKPSRQLIARSARFRAVQAMPHDGDSCGVNVFGDHHRPTFHQSPRTSGLENCETGARRKSSSDLPAGCQKILKIIEQWRSDMHTTAQFLQLKKASRIHGGLETG